jgi:predicted alpha/beta superfamily hydrolase
MRPLPFLLLALAWQPGFGRVLDNQLLDSHHLGGARVYRVYLPPSYDQDQTRRYPVLYLQDGQNVFSTAGTNAAFGWGSWALDKTADRLADEGKMPEIIMVAVDNSPARLVEYAGPSRDTNAPNTAFGKYAAFLVTELKPMIDGKYRTLPGPADTAVMGSSLGGVCSLALGWEHPDVFGGAASLSGSFMPKYTDFLALLRASQGPAKPVRIYLDYGVTDFMGGDDGRAMTGEVAAELRRLGWKDGLKTYVDAKPLTPLELEKTGLRRDKWSEAETSQHNEFYWRQRAWRALTFLFPPQ